MKNLSSVFKSILLFFATSLPALLMAQNNTFPSSGNVGIATTNPSTNLEVNGTIRNNLYLQFDKDANSNNIGMHWNAYSNGSFTYNYINTGAWGGTAGRLVGTGNNLSYDQASGGTNPITWTNRLTINSSGNVGIGTTNPSTKLEVNGKLTLNSAAWDDHLQITRSGYGGKFMPDNSAGTLGLRLDLIGTGSNFCILNGNVGINNPSPSAKLQVTNGSVLFNGTTGTTPVSGAGTRMMWIPAKYAFRAGFVSGTQWDDANIGYASIALGDNTMAKGSDAFAAGAYTNASESFSTAFGFNTAASGMYSTSFGKNTIASGNTSTTFGVGTTASSFFSTAFGAYTTASGSQSVSFGSYTTASGNQSAAFGSGTVAQAYSSFVLGAYNYNPGTYNATTWVATDPLFVISNGTSVSARSNAVTVLKNGNTGIGTTLANNPNNYKLAVAGIIGAKVEVIVENTSATWPDYVFEPGYERKDYMEKEIFLNKNKHLPGIDSKKEISRNGLQMSKTLAGITMNVEENTLDIIDLNKQNAELKKELGELKKEIEELKKK